MKTTIGLRIAVGVFASAASFGVGINAIVLASQPAGALRSRFEPAPLPSLTSTPPTPYGIAPSTTVSYQTL
jgi:hypothetical protein